MRTLCVLKFQLKIGLYEMRTLCVLKFQLKYFATILTSPPNPVKIFDENFITELEQT